MASKFYQSEIARNKQEILGLRKENSVLTEQLLRANRHTASAVKERELLMQKQQGYKAQIADLEQRLDHKGQALQALHSLETNHQNEVCVGFF